MIYRNLSRRAVPPNSHRWRQSDAQWRQTQDTGVSRTNRALPSNLRVQLGVFFGTEPQAVLPEAEAGVPHVAQNPPMVQGLINDNNYSSVKHVDSYVKLSPVPFVYNYQDVQFVNFVKPVQKVGVNVTFVAAHVHTVFTDGQPQKNGPSPIHVQNKIKHVRDVSSVNQSLFALSVPNVHLAAVPPPVVG